MRKRPASVRFLNFLVSRLKPSKLVFAVALVSIQPPLLPKNFLPVPLVRQATSYSCGAASLMSVLSYWSVFDDSESSLYRKIGTTSEDGTEPEPMAAHARALGLSAEVLRNQTQADLRRALERGETWILDIEAWPSDRIFWASAVSMVSRADHNWSGDWDNGHYVVLVGIDEQYAYLMDPSVLASYSYIPLSELDARWHDVELQNGVNQKIQHLAIRVSGSNPALNFPRALVKTE